MKIKFKGIDNSGMVRDGVIEAKNINEAEEKLSLQGLSNLKLEVLASKSGFSLPFFKGKVKERDLAIFTRQFGALINAGVGIAEGLEILSEQLPNKTLSAALKEIKEDVVAGMSLSKAMDKHRNVFPDFLIHLTSAAEESGSLDVVLMRATVYFEKIAAIKRKIVSASWYPTAVIIIASLIVLGILTFVVPTFAQLYAGFGAKLPFLTQIIIDASNFIKGNFLILLGSVIGFFVINSYIYKTPAGKEFYHRMFLRIPLLGEIFRKGAVAKFARTLATLVSGGVPIIRALEIASKVAGNVVIEKSILKTKDDVERGRQIYQSLDTHVFPPIFIAMVRVGENTGRLDEMLDTIAEFFEDEVDRAVEGLLSLIEPLLMVFIGGVVGLIIVALYLPIFKVGELLT